MSTWDDYKITCPRCTTIYEVKVASGLHISRLPHIREQIVDGKLHRFECPSCAFRTEVRRPLIYADFERGDWIEVWPADDIASWRERAVQCRASYERAIGRGAPMLRVHLDRFRVRIVFGYDELREKLVLWDARFDDVAVECAKLLAIRRGPSLLGERDRLLVATVTPPHITVARYRDDAVTGTFEIEATIEDLAAVRARVEPALELTDPFVSINRVVGATAVSGRDRSDPR